MNETPAAGIARDGRSGRMRRNTLLALFVVIMILGVTAALVFKSAFRRPACNIVLISLDTCRADCLGCYGYGEDATPNIDGVAREGIIFENAITTVPLTLPAHSSMLTGTIPPYHGVRANMGFRLGGSNETLAELLGKSDYVTAAIIGKSIMASEYGFAQGFDLFNDDFSGQKDPQLEDERRAGETCDLAVEWLEEHGDDRFFLFLHFYDPHDPYIPPEPFASRFRDNPYAGEIAYTDFCIGKVIEKLKKMGLYDSTFIVVTGDHGESFGEHGEEKHGYFIYNTTMKVPLVMKPPGWRGSRKVPGLTGVVDVVPTILGYLGLSQPENIHGIDLSPRFEADSPSGKKRFMYCESMYPSVLGLSSLHGIVSDRWKYIHTTRPELYDLPGDDDESGNVFAANRKVAGSMKKRLETILEQVRPVEIDGTYQADEERIDQIMGIGYLGAGVSEIAVLDEGRGDPKDYVEVANDVIEMTLFRKRGKTEEAVSLCEKILEKHPEMGIVHSALASMLEREGNIEEAISHFREAVAHEYGNEFDMAMQHFLLAGALSKKGEMEEAVFHYRKALKYNPLFDKAHCHLGAAFFALGNVDKAASHFTKALEISPGYSEAHFRLAVLLERSGRIRDAIAAYRESIRLDPERPDPADSLARLLATHRNERLRRPEEAVVLAERACQLTARRNPFFLQTLATAYLAAGRREEAVTTAEEALKAAQAGGRKILAAELEKLLRMAR